MQRRDFVRAIVAATMAPKVLMAQVVPVPKPTGMPAAAPVPWMTGLNPSTPLPATETADAIGQAESYFFSPVQMETLTHLSDVLLPPIAGNPGAVEVGTPAFLDFFVSASAADRKALYQGGLDWLEDESKKRFSKPFAKLDAGQADKILRPWLRTWMSDHPPTELHAAFVNEVHADIRTATINSKAWSDAPVRAGKEKTSEGLYWSPVEPDMFGLGSEPGRRAAASATRS